MEIKERFGPDTNMQITEIKGALGPLRVSELVYIKGLLEIELSKSSNGDATVEKFIEFLDTTIIDAQTAGR